MTRMTDQLPDDVTALKALVLSQRENYQQQITSLQEQLRLLIHKRFGRSSEQVAPDQLGLFNEAEAEDIETNTGTDKTTDTTPVAAHQRKPKGRKPLPEFLTRVDVIHDLTDKEKVCPHDGIAVRLS